MGDVSGAERERVVAVETEVGEDDALHRLRALDVDRRLRVQLAQRVLLVPVRRTCMNNAKVVLPMVHECKAHPESTCVKNLKRQVFIYSEYLPYSPVKL